MPVNLSIKNAPDEVVRRLRERAERHHRSLQGELLAIIEEAVRPERELSPAELLAEIRRLGLRTPGNSGAIIRAGRNPRPAKRGRKRRASAREEQWAVNMHVSPYSHYILFPYFCVRIPTHSESRC